MPKFTVTPEEANFVLQTLANLPTSSNAWPLLQKLGQQAQVPDEPQPVDRKEDSDAAEAKA